jgi:hypothetical protein
MFAARHGFSPVDLSRTAKVLTAQSGAFLQTSPKQYGTASGFVGNAYANNKAIYAAYNSTGATDFQDIGQWTNFTAECWVRYVAMTTIDDGGYPATMGCMELGDYPMNWSFGADRNGSLRFVYVIGSTWYVINSANSLITAAGSFYHIAVVKQGTAIACYLNGTSVATGTLAGTISTAARPFSIGSYYRIGANANVDELRLSKSARYTTSFTPAGPFVNDLNTLMLLHMDGTNGSTTITDDNL